MEEQLEMSFGIDKPAVEKRKGLLAEIEEMKNTGQTSTPEFAEKMRELEKILGMNQVNPFGTSDEAVFEQDLNRMTLSDLQSMASKHGVSPAYPVSTIKDLLKKAFVNWNRNSLRNVMPAPSESIKLDPNNPQHAKTIKILNEF